MDGNVKYSLKEPQTPQQVHDHHIFRIALVDSLHYAEIITLKLNMCTG